MPTPTTPAVMCDTVDVSGGISICTKMIVMPGLYGQVSSTCNGYNSPLMALRKVVLCAKSQNLSTCTVTKQGFCMVSKLAQRSGYTSYNLVWYMRYGSQDQKLQAISTYFSDPNDFTSCQDFTGTGCYGISTPSANTVTVDSAKAKWSAGFTQAVKAF